jgi:branched-subunit amino acid transport protein
VSALLAVLAAGAGSYVFRLSMVAVGGRFRSLRQVERTAHLIVPITFAAVAAGGVVASTNYAGAGPPLAAVAAGVVAVRQTGRSYAGIAAGMPTLWALSAVLGG